MEAAMQLANARGADMEAAVELPLCCVGEKGLLILASPVLAGPGRK